MVRRCAVSVDLDGIDLYRGLHGLEPAPQHARDPVHSVGLSRAMSLAEQHRVPVTLFAIGRALEVDANAEAVRAAARRGARVESHSHGHRYDLSRLPRTMIAADLERAAEVIEGVTDRRPRGFRAPGYVQSEDLLAVVGDIHAFDASPLPCPPYWLAKLAAATGIRLRGRQSLAIIDDFGSQLAPRQPRHRRGVWQIPNAVTRRWRWPVIGTSLVLGGAVGARALLRGCLGDDVISLEFHGVDFLDATDGLSTLAPHQWDVRVPLRDKLAIFGEVIERLRSAGYAFVPLEAITP